MPWYCREKSTQALGDPAKKRAKYIEKLTLGRRFNTSSPVLPASSFQSTIMFHVKQIMSPNRNIDVCATTPADVHFSPPHGASVRN